VHSFRSLLADLATLTRNTVVAAINPDHPFTITARPTPLQQKAFDLLGVTPECTQ
ncbi:MAG: tail length tape measure protein, partial [Alphaproteobacteria bacterium]|nr:tail length tape measure protein [Alphaproteobacteria bacterium]